ncbi:hypothetical protein [Cohnella hashimotonis]|uniref:Uncharacterized protein n=1 Tax=Cohnella hashimotonis TaxID=2826895 RepID=A0ABT6TCQ7_9BACL|nr:hypothetical protein [Cohnella hashimotonis]MDI4643734.1 hypothetical protein [Cohnella hashimotonis]
MAIDRKIATLALAAATALAFAGCGAAPEPAGSASFSATVAATATNTTKAPTEEAVPTAAPASIAPSASTASTAPPTPPAPAPDADPEHASLRWEQVPPPPPAERFAKWPATGTRTIRTYPVPGENGRSIVVYAKEGDTESLYAAISMDGDVFGLGRIAGYLYDKKENVTVEKATGLFGGNGETVKLTGSTGASATIALYVGIRNGVPEPLLAIEEGLVREVDLDFDGKPEIAATGGLPMSTRLYRWNGRHAETCDLNAALGAESVAISPELAIEATDGSEDSVRLYWFSPERVSRFAEYTMEEYTSDTFVSIPYEKQELNDIKDAARDIGLAEPYAAAKGIATDYGLRISIEDKDVLSISYPHFFIRQSKRDLRPESGATRVRKIVLKDGPAYWIETAGTADWYLRRGDTYLSVGTAKPFGPEQLLFAVASLIPLHDIQSR